MPDKKISQLSSAASLTGSEPVPVVQGGATLQATVYQVQTAPMSPLTANGVMYLNGSKVPTSGSGLLFDGNNLGLGVTPVTGNWSPLFQVKRAIFNGGNSDRTEVGYNYYRTSGVNTYIATDFATLYDQISGQHRWFTAPSGTAGNTISFTQAMTLTAGGNLLVGTTSDGFRANITGTSSAVGTPSNYVFVTDGRNGASTTDGGRIYFGRGGATTLPEAAGFIGSFTASSAAALAGGLIFGTNGSDAGGSTPTERARITSGGELCIGQTAVFGNPTMVAATGAKPGFASRHTSSGAGKYFYFGADQNNSYIVYNQAGTGVYVTDGGTSWTATSDERLKTDLAPIQNAAEKVASLRAVTGRYKTDPSDVSRAFLIAQDVQAVLPEAVNVQNDEIGTLGLAYTDTIPLLVAAIKEQQALIEDLRARVAALEAA